MFYTNITWQELPITISVLFKQNLYVAHLIPNNDPEAYFFFLFEPYFQPTPAPPSPFSINSAYDDPTFPNGLDHAWALNVQQSNNILVYGKHFFDQGDEAKLTLVASFVGAGLYSFFQVQTHIPMFSLISCALLTVHGTEL